jgi:hypothetical protein
MTNRDAHAQVCAPGASNHQGYKRRGTRMKHKTERGDRGDRIDVLTNGGDGRRWPDFEVNAAGGGSVRRRGGAPVVARRLGEAGRRD